MNYYIYYRVKADSAEWRANLRAMQSALARECGVEGELLRKTDEPVTWMEVYEGVRDAALFEAAMTRLLREYRVEENLSPGTLRHTERFEPL